MKNGKWKLHRAIGYCVIGCLLMAAPAAAQTTEPRVTLGGTFGLARMDGGMHASRVVKASARVLDKVSADVEFSLTGPVDETSSPFKLSELHRTFRERGFTLGVRYLALRKAGVSLEPVVGLARLAAACTAEYRYVSTAPGQLGWSPWFSVADTDCPQEGPTWALSVGLDVPLGTRRFAVVPDWRWRMPLTESTQGGLRVAIGIRAGF